MIRAGEQCATQKFLVIDPTLHTHGRFNTLTEAYQRIGELNMRKRLRVIIEETLENGIDMYFNANGSRIEKLTYYPEWMNLS